MLLPILCSDDHTFFNLRNYSGKVNQQSLHNISGKAYLTHKDAVNPILTLWKLHNSTRFNLAS